MASPDDYMIVAAIDFGTTYSGYAFQLTSEYKPDDPTKKILSPQSWNSGSAKLVSLKTPTCLLLDRNQDIDSFGFLAEERYADLCMDNDNKNWYFFRRFKMKLHESKDLSKKTELSDETDKKMSALKVFGLSIQCLKDSLFGLLGDQGIIVDHKDILWVLTVPAIWDDPAKQFMREAANLAGIKSHQLKISLEPEAASLFCQYLPVEKFSVGGNVKFSDAKPGTTYMIVDLGGGTADITVHEKVSSGKLKEIHRASGGPWGGTAVDSAFISMISSIIGGPVMAVFMKEQKYDYLELMREFESVKRNVGLATSDSIKMKMPVSLNDTCMKVVHKDFKELVKIARKDKQITFIGDKAKFDPDLMKSLFKKTTDKVVSHMKQILDTTQSGKKVSLILMVGGFSESVYVQDVIKAEFHDKKERRVLIPKDAGISVVQGAVIFGRQPGNITSRVLRFTYGAQIAPIFVDGTHDPSKKYTDQAKAVRCRDVFKTFIKAGTEVKVGHQVDQTYHTTVPFQSDTDLKVFISENDCVAYTDNKACRPIGHMTVKIPTPSKEIRELSVQYVFGDTELHVKGLDVFSNTPCNATLTMLD